MRADVAARFVDSHPWPRFFPKRSNVHAKVTSLSSRRAGLWRRVGRTTRVFWSPYTTYVDVPLAQPVPFSHKHHVGDDGIDCRYCHASVEKSSFAGIPSTQVCMTCHSQIWTEAALLAPVRPKPGHRAAAAVESGQRPARLRLFQSQHPHQQRDRLFDLPRSARSDAAHLAGANALHEVVPGVPSRPAELRPAALRRFTTCIGNRRLIRRTQGPRLVEAISRSITSGRLTNCSHCHR